MNYPIIDCIKLINRGWYIIHINTAIAIITATAVITAVIAMFMTYPDLFKSLASSINAFVFAAFWICVLLQAKSHLIN